MPFNAKKFIETSTKDIRNTIGQGRAITAVSGGVDSFVAATLAAHAIPGQMLTVYVDTGMMRKGETESVMETARSAGIPLKVVRAREKFLKALLGVTDPEKKRKIIGEMFIRIFEEEAKAYKAGFLVQGTIAPDWIESGGLGRDTIKSHHNVGGLPEKMDMKLCEPLRELYKHEVRMLGKELGLPESIHQRQPFPGPGLAVRIVGEITEEKVAIVQDACDHRRA